MRRTSSALCTILLGLAACTVAGGARGARQAPSIEAREWIGGGHHSVGAQLILAFARDPMLGVAGYYQWRPVPFIAIGATFAPHAHATVGLATVDLVIPIGRVEISGGIAMGPAILHAYEPGLVGRHSEARLRLLVQSTSQVDYGLEIAAVGEHFSDDQEYLALAFHPMFRFRF
ncbi:MAG: hypothetical protein HYV09_36245 [Deltaproteobacteria bacterium]|nr:hypothetical protein [Deltaproteobacteria bacterium]